MVGPILNIDIGLKVHQPGASFEQIKSLAMEAEESGFTSVWGFDHLNPANGDEILEVYSTIAALSTLTKRVRLGVMVTSVGYRHPALLANIVATIDRISGGRMELGIGAGSKGFGESDHTAYGLDFPRHKERVEKLEEACTIIKELWTKDRVTFNGRFFNLREAACGIRPIQRPHPPIIIGGASKEIMRLAARCAQEWNLSTSSPDVFFQANERIESICKKMGRDSATLRRSVQIFIGNKPEPRIRELVDSFVRSGATRVVLIPKPPYEPGLAMSLIRLLD